MYVNKTAAFPYKNELNMKSSTHPWSIMSNNPATCVQRRSLAITTDYNGKKKLPPHLGLPSLSVKMLDPKEILLPCLLPSDCLNEQDQGTCTLDSVIWFTYYDRLVQAGPWRPFLNTANFCIGLALGLADKTNLRRGSSFTICRTCCMGRFQWVVHNTGDLVAGVLFVLMYCLF